MKIKYVLVGIYSLCILCTSCGRDSREENIAAIENSQGEKEEEQMETQVEMTEEQKDLLIKISIDEESVQEGDLSEWQKEVLRQYDYVMEYLKKKYPSYTFHIDYCEPKDIFNSYSKFWFTEESDSEGDYELYLEIEENQYSAKDNFYGHIIGPKYEAKLMELLKQENIPCDRVEVGITTVQGESFNEQMDVDEMINGNLIVKQTTLFHIDKQKLNGASYESVYNQIHQWMDKKKIYGYYIVTIYDSMNANNEVFRDSFDEYY